MKTKYCKICGKEFTGRNNLYCSEDCQKKGHIERQVRYREENPEKFRRTLEKNKEKYTTVKVEKEIAEEAINKIRGKTGYTISAVNAVDKILRDYLKRG